MYGDLARFLYSVRYSTWLEKVLIGVCGLYCIGYLFCLGSISWLVDILLYVTIRYWMSINRVPVNWPVVLFLMSVMYLDSTFNTSFCISAYSTPRVL